MLLGDHEPARRPEAAGTASRYAAAARARRLTAASCHGTVGPIAAVSPRRRVLCRSRGASGSGTTIRRSSVGSREGQSPARRAPARSRADRRLRSLAGERGRQGGRENASGRRRTSAMARLRAAEPYCRWPRRSPRREPAAATRREPPASAPARSRPAAATSAASRRGSAHAAACAAVRTASCEAGGSWASRRTSRRRRRWLAGRGRLLLGVAVGRLGRDLVDVVEDRLAEQVDASGSSYPRCPLDEAPPGEPRADAVAASSASRLRPVWNSPRPRFT